MNELAYVLINPYTIRKSRTGGILARYLGRTDLRLVAARMFGPSRQMAERYAAAVRNRFSASANRPRFRYRIPSAVLLRASLGSRFSASS